MNTDQEVRSQRAWARVAGLMYWVVLVLDMSGMLLHLPILGFFGAVGVIPLAFGLYYAVRLTHLFLAATALGLRLLEATLGMTGGLGSHAPLAATSLGPLLLKVARWDHETDFAAFVFTIASIIFFYLFVRSRLIPPVLSWLGLFASGLALAACLAHLVRPAFPAMTMSAWIPMLLAETSTGLWLLLKSVSSQEQGSASPLIRNVLPRNSASARLR